MQEECHPGQRRREGQAHLHEQTFVVMDDGLGNTAEPGDSLGGLQAALTDSDEDEFYDAQSQNENSESGAADLLADIAADVAGEAAAAVGSNDEHSSRDDDDGFVIVDSPVGNESTEFRQLEEDLRESRSCSSSSSSREYSTGFQAPGPAVKGDSSCDADIGAVSTSLHGEGVQEARKEVSPLLEKVPELSCEEKKVCCEGDVQSLAFVHDCVRTTHRSSAGDAGGVRGSQGRGKPFVWSAAIRGRCGTSPHRERWGSVPSVTRQSP